MYVNELFLIGRVMNDPEKIHDSPIGVRFKLITSESYYSKFHQKKVENEEIHNIKAWRQNAIFALERLKKDMFVLIKGKLHYHTYKTNDGQIGKIAEIICTSLTKLDN